MKFFFSLAILCMSISGLSAQDNNESPADSLSVLLLEELEFNDISHLWSGSKAQDNKLGFIGKDYERLRIRILSVIKNPDNPYEYFLYGKTLVSGTLCEFQGSLQITEAGFYETQANADFAKGFLYGDYVLAEDASCLHSGVFRGSFQTDFYIDDNWTFYYDNLNEDLPNYRNNQFEGRWYPYREGEAMTANWGDSRIPGSDDLDAGFAEFLPSLKYLKNGWDSFETEIKNRKAGEEIGQWWK